MKRALAFAVAACFGVIAAPAAAIGIQTDGGLSFTDDHGRVIFEGGSVEFRRVGIWQAADVDPQVEAVTDDIARVTITAPAGFEGIRVSFATAPGERFLGFGERSDAVVRTGGDVDNRVTEGPYQPIESPFVRAFVPPPGQSDRADATYFPIPWLLSSRGAGFLLRNDDHSVFRLGSPWSAEVDATTMTFEVFAGPTPADALRSFTARVGRQPRAAAPFYFGPWWQPKGDEAENLRVLREAGAAGSLVQTYTHYLPCGDHEGRTDAQRARTERFHDAGLAVTTYFNPMVCTSYTKRFEAASAAGALTKDSAGNDYRYRYQGSSVFFVGQYDFTTEAGVRLFGDALDEAVKDGYDGWMEDFGEYTPDDGHQADGSTGSAGHNRYVVDYHAAARKYALERAGRPLARFNRSGWTGAARHSQIVWGGDPSTTWGFDGLESAVRNGLSMGLSGVSLWGSDIGGFFALSEPQTPPELMRRWIQFGFASGVMRMQANGYSLGARQGRRAQITDPEVLPTWTRYARLRTQLYPYLARAQREYDRTGMPMMRALALAYPDDPAAVAREDTYLLGPDLLVAPVVKPGATKKSVYLPEGRWVDFWRSVRLKADGSPKLRRAVVLSGGREVEVDAEDLPIFVRAGAVLELLGADVDTLSSYGKGNTVRLADRTGRRSLLAWTRKARVRQPRKRRLSVQMAYGKRVCRRTVRMRSGVIRACRKPR